MKIREEVKNKLIENLSFFNMFSKHRLIQDH